MVIARTLQSLKTPKPQSQRVKGLLLPHILKGAKHKERWVRFYLPNVTRRLSWSSWRALASDLFWYLSRGQNRDNREGKDFSGYKTILWISGETLPLQKSKEKRRKNQEAPKKNKENLRAICFSRYLPLVFLCFDPCLGFPWAGLIQISPFTHEKITPLQWDPKQQELKTRLRPRLVLGPYGGLVWSRTLKT